MGEATGGHREILEIFKLGYNPLSTVYFFLVWWFLFKTNDDKKALVRKLLGQFCIEGEVRAGNGGIDSGRQLGEGAERGCCSPGDEILTVLELGCE